MDKQALGDHDCDSLEQVGWSLCHSHWLGLEYSLLISWNLHVSLKTEDIHPMTKPTGSGSWTRRRLEAFVTQGKLPCMSLVTVTLTLCDPFFRIFCELHLPLKL